MESIMNAQQFLERIAETADAPRLDAHTNPVSKDVSVFGVPGFDVMSTISSITLTAFGKSRSNRRILFSTRAEPEG